MQTTTHFADRVIQRARTLGHPLCVGLDPHLPLIPPLFRAGDMAPGAPETAEAVARFMEAMVERVAGKAAVVKPQLAFFEQLGAPGIAALACTVAAARAAGLPVLLDGKRGDIGSTAEAYARAWLAPEAPIRGDGLTVNPYLGVETLQPYFDATPDAGIFVLVKTSNPGSGDFQDLDVGGRPLWQRVAAALAPVADARLGATGWSSLGVVVGATWPEQGEQLRELLPNALFLIPGYGAQGGSARDAARCLVQGPRGREGGIVNSSRGVTFPPAAAVAETAAAWEAAIDEAVAAAGRELAAAVRG